MDKVVKMECRQILNVNKARIIVVEKRLQGDLRVRMMNQL